MNNQPKRAEKSKKILPFPSVAEGVVEPNCAKPKRGRPKSPLDAATLNRIRVQRHREAKRDADEVKVEIFLPKAWHHWLRDVRGVNLRETAVEAFALWLEKQGYSPEIEGKPPLVEDA